MYKLGKRTAARIMAVQSVYSCEFLGVDNINLVDILSYLKSQDDYIISDYDNTLLSSLLDRIGSKCEDFDGIIKKYLGKSWKLERLEMVVIIILKIAICELIYFTETLTNVIIDEYTTITSYFSGDKEVDFVNAVLQKIALEIR
ncbi:MAG: transcription antitermination factor NusB [Rickettsiaceae bacterium H1]|nr:transcription antitermination factor NusB [Rickettsiaceae bacterium H1]